MHACRAVWGKEDLIQSFTTANILRFLNSDSRSSGTGIIYDPARKYADLVIMMINYYCEYIVIIDDNDTCVTTCINICDDRRLNTIHFLVDCVVSGVFSTWFSFANKSESDFF